MKKLIILLLCCITLAACQQTISTPETTEFPETTEYTEIILTPDLLNITIYCGNENADGFQTLRYEVAYFNSATLIEHLIEIGVLFQDVTLLSEEYDGSCLHLDFNDAFRDLLCSTGTTGEYIIIGSLVNTFLENYSDLATSIFLTVNGEILESGHVIYDFELTYHE